MSDTPMDYGKPLAAAISSILDIAVALENERDALRTKLIEVEPARAIADEAARLYRDGAFFDAVMMNHPFGQMVREYAKSTKP